MCRCGAGNYREHEEAPDPAQTTVRTFIVGTAHVPRHGHQKTVIASLRIQASLQRAAEVASNHFAV